MSATFTDNEIKIQGVDALIKSLGEVQAERFISLILREPFDYTEWQKKLWTSQDIEDISKMAMDFQKNKSTSE